MIPAMIVPMLTRPELLDQMVASIDHPIHTLVVIDNGDHDELCVGSRHVERIALIQVPANLGVASSWNLGIKVTPHAPWWLIANFDVTWPPGALTQFATQASRNTLLLSAGAPPWCAFTIGDHVVDQVGLFDESFHPAYFEDNDYQRRCATYGIPVIQSTIPVHHTNSSTLNAGYHDKNNHTFTANHNYYQHKVRTGDVSEGRWDLGRRRVLSWD